MNILLLGPQGSGKGTQAERIVVETGLPHINTGDLLRAEIRAGTELGRNVEAILARGDLVSDDIVIELVRKRLQEPDTGEGFVLEGFPRTLAQADALDAMLAELDRELSVVLHFQLPEDIAFERLRLRGRNDDNPETIRHRMNVQRVPDEVIEYYRTRGILVGIHADRSVDEVFAEVQDVLETAATR